MRLEKQEGWQIIAPFDCHIYCEPSKVLWLFTKRLSLLPLSIKDSTEIGIDMELDCYRTDTYIICYLKSDFTLRMGSPPPCYYNSIAIFNQLAKFPVHLQ